MEEFQSRNNLPNAEHQRLILENAEMAKMSELINEQLKLARDRINYLDTLMIEKDSYIEAMEDLQMNESSNQAAKDLEDKCMQLLQEKNDLAR